MSIARGLRAGVWVCLVGGLAGCPDAGSDGADADVAGDVALQPPGPSPDGTTASDTATPPDASGAADGATDAPSDSGTASETADDAVDPVVDGTPAGDATEDAVEDAGSPPDAVADASSGDAAEPPDVGDAVVAIPDANPVDATPPDAVATDAGFTPTSECVTGSDGDCIPGQFCLAEGCGQGLAGTCMPMPTGCGGAPWDGACGCNGQTYGSPCDAYKQGINIAGYGSCPEDAELTCEVSECFGPGIGCDDTAGEYCMGGCEGVGFCKVKEIGNCSPYDIHTVCGCNGQTYLNPCFAQQVGINVAHEGSCPPPDLVPCTEPGQAECPEGWLCDVDGCEQGDPGVCLWLGALGELTLCSPGTKLCIFPDPECGCDGVDYTSACTRITAGAAFAHKGLCSPDSCELDVQGDCPLGQYCSSPMSNQCSGTGECAYKPTLCLSVFPQKVCGCYGNTYDVPCKAHLADEPIAFYGECQ